MGIMRDDYRDDGENGRIGSVSLIYHTTNHLDFRVLRLANSLPRYTTIGTVDTYVTVYPVEGTDGFYAFSVTGIDYADGTETEYLYTFRYTYIFHDNGSFKKIDAGTWSRTRPGQTDFTKADKGSWVSST